MGEHGGFLKYKRAVKPERPVEERILDWNEFYLNQSVEETKKQAARCMECGTPFCHTGDMIGGMASGCPVHNLIPEWNDLIYRGLWQEAYKRLTSTSDFPEFTSRVCPALCEGSCTAGLNQEPVTIKANEKAIIETAFENGWVVPKPPEKRTGKKVAVVGSGPSGLACAKNLNSFGHEVVVYEREDRVGGLLTYGIPNMKLDKEKVVKRRVDILKAEGIVFKTNVDIGKDITINELKDEYDAIVLCGGATKPRDLNVEGRDLKGVHFAVDFLTRNTKNVLSEGKYDGLISAKDKRVVVIGGGDTGTDCVATSIRHGCKHVMQLEIMPMPPKCRQANNPWPEWPKVLKVDYGQEEAIELYGKDPRNYLVMTEKLIGDENGNVKGIQVVDILWGKDDKGRFYPSPIEETRRVLETELVLLAMGFVGPEDYTVNGIELARDPRSNIETSKDGYMTKEEKVFAAGDMRRGQSLVVWAMKEGREAANEVNDYLNA